MTRFALIGAGGLGGPIAYALAAAGAELTVCDFDRVELSNLQRQIQFSMADIGRNKADALADELRRRGHDTSSLRLIDDRFDDDTADAVLADADVVIDGTDDFATKFRVCDHAVARGLPYVIGGVLRYTGQVFSAYPGAGGCYRCLFEEPPGDDAPTCADAGVLGAVVAVIGAVAARAALELAAGPRASSLRVFDDFRSDRAPRTVRFEPRPGCATCDPSASVSAKEAVL